MMLSFFHPLSLRSQTCNFPVQCFDVCCDPEFYQITTPAPNETVARVSALILQGRLLPMAGVPNNATNTLQRLIVDRPLIVDVPYTFFTGSELVFNQNAASLDVQSTLTLRGTHLHGCGVVWDGIFVRNGASLLAYNNCIEDGRRAIRLLDGARYELVRNNFQRNFVSIFGGNPDPNGTVGTNLWQLGNGIIGNNISGLAPLLQTTEGATHPFHGIEIYLVNEMSIGLAGTNPVTRNVIHDFAATSTFGVSGSGAIGITSINSNLTVNNTQFFNIGMNTHAVGGTAIDALSRGWQYELNVNGLGGLEASTATFNNCETSVRSQDNILRVRNCRLDRGVEHIRVNFPLFPHRFTITNNYFEGYQNLGVSFNQGLYRSGTVENNTFEDDNSDLPWLVTGIAASTGLNAVGIGPQQPSNTDNFFRIRYNHFFDRQKNFPTVLNGWGSIGVSLFTLHNVADVDDNDFLQENISQGSHSYQGILLQGSWSNQIRYNTFTGVANNPTPIDPNTQLGMAAIDVSRSGNNIFRCNMLSNVRDGMRFTDPLCDGSFIWGNSMTGHNVGLRLLEGSKVGPQIKRWNTWPMASVLEASNENVDVNTANMSQFFIQVPQFPLNNFWPQPFNAPPGSSWFNYAGGPTTPLEDFCVRDDGGDERVLTTADDLVLTNQYPAYKGYPATQWEATYLLYDRLYNWPELRTSSSASETFYNAQSSTNIGKLHNALRQYGAIGAVPSSIEASLDANYVQTENTLEQIAAKHEAMATVSSVSEQDQILQDLQSLGTQLQALAANKATLSTTHLSERSNKIAALQTYLTAITTTNVPEQNLKSVLTVLTDAMAANAGDTYTTAQRSTLEGIAAQCRYAGGYGVVLARIALKKNLSTYNDEAMCPSVGGAQGGSEDRQTSDLSSTALSLSPNPVAHTLQVGLPSAAFSKGQLQVWNMLGSQVRSLTLQSGSSTATVDLSGLPDGHYLLEAIMDGQRLPVQRFVKHSR